MKICMYIYTLKYTFTHTDGAKFLRRDARPCTSLLRRYQFSKVSSVLISYSKFSSEPTFENFYP